MSTCSCGQSGCDCICVVTKVGSATPNFIQYQTISDDCAASKISSQAKQVDVCGNIDRTLTLPKGAAPGRPPLTINNTGSGFITLTTEDGTKIVGANADGNVILGPQSSVIATLAHCEEQESQKIWGEWAILGSDSQILTADYVVVGFGTAGCPLARYLSEDMTTSVVVLEAGLDQQTNPEVLSALNVVGDTTLSPTSGNMPVSADPALNFVYSVDASDVILPNRATYPHTGGRMWGGSSAHATLFAIRGTPGPYDDWGAINPQWNYDNLLPLMKFAEAYVPNGTVADLTQRGTTGPISIVQRPPHQVSNFYTSVSTVLSAPDVPDVNAPPTGNIGLSSAQQYLKTDFLTRSWSQDFTPPSVLETLADGNGKGVGDRKLSVISRATAQEILFDDTQTPPVAVGVRYFLGGASNGTGSTRIVLAKKKVILCAGILESVKLLQLSGIGPTALLTKFGIPIRVANENVGRNVQTHYGFSMILPQDGGSPTPVNEFTVAMWDGSNSVNPNGQANDGIRRVEVLMRTSTTQFVTPQVSTALNLVPSTSISIFGFLIRNTNKLGSIEITSNDPNTLPLFSPRYYQDPTPPGGKSDMDRVVDFVLATADISLAYSGLMPTFPPAYVFPNTYPGGLQADTTLLRTVIKEDVQSPFLVADHSTGALRMAASAATGVVDGNLDVFGVQHLAVCDNSVIPEITDNHTMWPPMILGLQKAKIEGAVGLP